MPIEALGNRNFRPFGSCDFDLDPVTFIYELEPYVDRGYAACANINFLREGFRKLSYDIRTYVYIQTDRQTDRHIHDQNYAPRRFAGGQNCKCFGVWGELILKFHANFAVSVATKA